jgi:uncharacterized membrane protein YwaF
MSKLLLLSTIIAMIAIPTMAARMKNGRKGLQVTIIAIVVYNLFYLFAVRYLYPRLL